MAVSKNLWLDGAKQKLAGAVTYTLKGQQIIRKEAPQVANPRTTAQMNQRVRLANLVNFYRANQSWMKRGAFENKKQTQSDYNAFVSRNIGASQIALTKAEALAGAAIASTYQVTDGSLPRISYAVNEGTLSIPLSGTTANDAGSVSELLDFIKRSYPALREGDQISIIMLANKRDVDGYPRLEVFPTEIILSDDDEEQLTGIINTGGRAISKAFTAGTWSFTVTPKAGESIAFIICASRSTSSGLKVSPSYVTIGDWTFVDGYSSQEQFQEAINSYGESSANFLDSTSVVAGDSNTPSGGDNQGGSGAGDPGDVEP